MLFSELQKKEVINIHSCQKIGHVVDAEFDECTGQICKIIIAESFNFCKFLYGSGDTIIRFKDICQIGPDIILVDLGGK